ncbi:MAG: hypothetical protein K2M37_01580 [Muribaculaceae bacterium]|nr:hypothetical protein [Muribaculaceae bacterium]
MSDLRYDEEDFNGFLEDLITSERSGTKEVGITKLFWIKVAMLCPKNKNLFLTKWCNKTQKLNVKDVPLLFHGVRCWSY